MKFGIVFSNIATFGQPEGAVALARAAEENGIESLWTVEHVVVPAGYRSEYPYAPDGRMPGPEDSPIPDPLIWLTYVAANTSRIKLATGILILPQREPLATAKALSTLDQLSGGRVLLGVGAGWLEEEFDAIGVPFARRGDRLDESIGALRALWTQDKATFEGEFFNFTDAISRPQPVRGSIPVHIGGHSRRAARRAGELGDGFFPGKGDADTLRDLLDVMRRAATDAGRDPDAIEVTAGGAMDVDTIRRYEDLGVHRIAIPPLAFDPEGIRTNLARFADRVISKLD
jgi:probable F420-dependent oxidoreductase